MTDPDTSSPGQYRGRTARYLALLLVSLLLILLLFSGAGFLVYAIAMAARSGGIDIKPMALIFIGLTLFSFLAVTVHALIGALIANDNLFSSAANPLEMARALYESFFQQGQTFVVILFVGIIASLMAGDVILPAEGLPIITAIVGFTLGRQFQRRNRDDGTTSG